MKLLLQKISTIIKNPVARNSGIMFVGTMATNFGAYLYHVVVGRIMGPENYSEFAALFSLLFLLSVPAAVIQLVLTKYFSQYKASGDTGQARSLLTRSFQYTGIASIIGLILYLPFVPFLMNALHIRQSENFIILYFITVGTFLVTTATGVLNGYQKFFASSFYTTIMTFIRLASGFLLAPLGTAMALLGTAISAFIGFAMFCIPLRFIFTPKPKPIQIRGKEITAYAIPTLLGTLGLTALYNMDVVLVKHFFDPLLAGIYASLTIFGKIIFFAASPITLVIFPMIIERKTQQKEYTSLFFMGLIAVVSLSFFIVAGYALFSSFVANLLFGERFIQAAPYLGYFGAFMAFATVANYLMTVSLAINKTRAGMIMFVGSVLQVAALYYFHSTIFQVITVNIIITVLLSFLLLIYYLHEPRHS